jgi:hypothetical protein
MLFFNVDEDNVRIDGLGSDNSLKPVFSLANLTALFFKLSGHLEPDHF